MVIVMPRDKHIRILPKVTITAEIRDKKGRIVKRIVEKGHSWTKNFGEVIMKMMYGNYSSTRWATITDTSGNTQTIDICDIQNHQYIVGLMGLMAGSGDDTWGIVVGSGTTSESVADYNLANKIPNGTSSGQLSYGAMESDSDITIGSNSIYWKMWRPFTNQSGNSITVNEIGIIAQYRGIKPGAVFIEVKYLIYRHVLSTPIIVQDGYTLTITITFSIPL